jgi:hypothetical protein
VHYGNTSPVSINAAKALPHVERSVRLGHSFWRGTQQVQGTDMSDILIDFSIFSPPIQYTSTQANDTLSAFEGRYTMPH